jgi:hypothetical protein
MKRDMELVRKILFQAESGANGFCPAIRVEGYDESQIGYHCYLIVTMGFAIGESTTGDTGPNGRMTYLTAAGHDFIDAIRDDTVWKRTWGLVNSAVSSVSVDLLKHVATHYAKEQMGLKAE